MYSDSGAATPGTSVLPVLRDGLGRALTDLRLSVTDRCNFRCTYCMPKEIFGPSHAFLPKSEILSFEELERVARVFVGLGVEKIRLTGGEPLLRRELDVLVARLAAIPGVKDLTLTTNGSALVNQAAALRKAGLHRLTVSVDALDDAVFRSMNEVDFPLHRVLTGIDTALEAGFAPIKINTVVKRGVNEQQILPLVRRFRGPQYVLRFIEYMDVGNSNGWRMEHVVPAGEILRIIGEEFPLEPLPAHTPSEVARRYRQRDGGGEIGVIASVTAPFCRGCTRARLSSDGKFYTCLFNGEGHDLRGLLRSGAGDEEMARFITQVWAGRGDRYSELRAKGARPVMKAEMSHIGG